MIRRRIDLRSRLFRLFRLPGLCAALLLGSACGADVTPDGPGAPGPHLDGAGGQRVGVDSSEFDGPARGRDSSLDPDRDSDDSGVFTARSCKSDKDCIELDMVCDKAASAPICVPCLADADCLAADHRCIGRACVKVQACGSDKDCLGRGEVCDKAAGVCVDCLGDVDCAAGERCRNHVCAARPKSCKSSKDCMGEGRVCDKAARVCVECLGDIDCPIERFCSQSQCLDDICKAGAKTCDEAGRLTTCEANGGGWKATSCPAGQGCVGGACAILVCTPAKPACEGNKLGTCNQDGTAIVGAASCGGDKTCVDGKCVGSTCTPGSKVCIGQTTIGTCQPGGSDYELKACPTGKVCEKGEKVGCVTPVCTAGQLFCQATHLMLCNSSGAIAELAQDCGATGQMCKNAKCSAIGACTPGEVICSADNKATRTCKADGSGFVSLACPPGWICAGNKCIRLVCTAGVAFCAENEVRKCTPDGTGADLVKACGASKQCAQGACIPKSCIPGATVCKDDTTLLTCNGSGSGYVAVPCPSACKDAKCS